MSFQWSDFLLVAKRLSLETDEAAQRSAISRAYYFIYHLAQERAVTNGLLLGPADPKHKLTWDFFTKSPDPECSRLGILGQRLRDQRNKADYDRPYPGRIQEEVYDVLEKADQFASRLAKVPARHPNSQSQRRVTR